MTKVIVAMSGGADSSAAAALLKEKGYEVTGVSMRNCCSSEGDIEDARRTARILGIPFHAFDLGREFEVQVLDYTCHEYLAGRTPNPCVRCNSMIKFGALINKARDEGIDFDYLATGHYAQVEYDEGKRRYLLKRGEDKGKDQTYFLSSLSQEQLRRSLFPLGTYSKEKVRGTARSLGMDIGGKRESQDFTAGDYQHLIEAMAKPGPILDKRGRVLGEHRGIPFYTIGQRRGLGISAGEPLYVSMIDGEKNAIIVGSKEDIYHGELTVSSLNWIAVEGPGQLMKLKVKIRYLRKGAEAEIFPLDKDRVRVKFKEPQMAIAPGQAAVFYDGDVVVGGGTID